MAKRTSKKKGTTRKKSSRKRRGNNWGILISLLGIILVLLIIVSYYSQRKASPFIAGEDKNTSSQQENQEPENKAPAISDIPEEKPPAKERPIEEPKVEHKETNPDLQDYKEVDEYYFTNSFDFAWPAYDVDDLIVEHEGFTLNYDEKNEQAAWVAYKLEGKKLKQGRFKRKDNFRDDPLVRTGSASPRDYAKSGYDRGHLAPAADFTWSETALDQTFFMSNMSPQEPSFNRGVWKKLEEQVRGWAIKNEAIYVVTGPVINDRTERIGPNKVTVPRYFYKAVLDIQEPELKAIGFLMENKKSDYDVLRFAVTIDKLEMVTGLDFFPLLPDKMESELEGAINTKLWK